MGALMKVAVRFSKRQELKALPILFRHSPGMILPSKIYVLSAEALATLREAGVRYTLLANTIAPPTLEQAATGVRI